MKFLPNTNTQIRKLRLAKLDEMSTSSKESSSKERSSPQSVVADVPIISKNDITQENENKNENDKEKSVLLNSPIKVNSTSIATPTPTSRILENTNTNANTNINANIQMKINESTINSTTTTTAVNNNSMTDSNISTSTSSIITGKSQIIEKVELGKSDIRSASPPPKTIMTSLDPITTPSRKRDISISSSSKSITLSGGKSEIHNLIATNLALESVFLVTYRIEAAHFPIKYIGSNTETETGSTDYINHTNVSEIVCTLLSEESVIGGAIGYLLGSYKRLIEKENAVAERVREDLVRYRVILYCNVLHSFVLYCKVLYCIVLRCTHSTRIYIY